jgi:uncharacterized RDD family membrane protein YckC
MPETAPPAITEGKGFGIRALAYVIDNLVLIGAGQVIGVVVGTILGTLLIIFTGDVPSVANESTISVLDFVLGFFNFALYFTLFEWLFGASLGKLIMGLRVVKEDGAPCGPGGAIVRALFRYIDGLIFGLIAHNSMKKTPLNQRLGDHSAKTVVVDAKDPGIKDARSLPWFLVAAVAFVTVAGAATFVALLTVFL